MRWSGAGRIGSLAMVVVGGLVVVILGGVMFAGTRPGAIDDALITLVYARHLAEDGALYWNRSDGPVDGFSSLADVAVKAALWDEDADPVLRSWWLTALWHGGVVLVLFTVGLRLGEKRGRSVGPGLVLGILAGLAVAGDPALARGSAFLLETPLYGLLVVICTLGAGLVPSRPSRLAVILWSLGLVALVLTRHEGIPMAFLLLALFARDRIRRGDRRNPLLAGSLLLGTTVAYLGWRLALFGRWAPNTYYAKTSASRWNEVRDGLEYVWEYVSIHPGGALGLAVLVLGPLAAMNAPWRDDRLRHGFEVMLAAAWLALAEVIWAGGDSYFGGRFLAPVTLLVVVALTTAVGGIEGPFHRIPILLLVTIGVVQLFPSQARYGQRWKRIIEEAPLSEERFACDREAIGRIAEIVGSGPVAESDYQRFKYFADGVRVIDLHGLNTRWIAEIPREGPVSFGKFSYELALQVDAPAWFLGFRLWSRSVPLARYPVSELVRRPRMSVGLTGRPVPSEAAGPLVRRYTTASLPVCDRFLNFLVRRDRIGAFREAGVLVHP